MAWAAMNGLEKGEMYVWVNAVRITEKPIAYWFGMLAIFWGVIIFLIIGMGWR